jgi:hypothetical protein
MADFNSIKEKLADFTLSSVVKSSHDLLVAVENAKDKTYPFWNVLVLLKWAYGNCNDSTALRGATIVDIEDIVALINEFHDGIKLVDFKKGVKSELKKIAFQQFWFQDHIDMEVLCRSEVFFNHIETRVDIDKEFKGTSGLSIPEFLNCVYLLYLYFHRDQFDKEVQFDGVLYPEDLDVIAPFTGKETLITFLQLIIFPMTEPNSLQKMKLEAYQLYETTLWNRYPLLLVRNQVVLIHRSPLKSMIRNFLYDYLKKNSIPFRTEIGERMEKYVELGIKETNSKYISEKQLQVEFPRQKVCDFLIEGDVLVECKAIELSPTAGIKRSKEILQNEFDTNATKAYIQLLSVASNMKSKIQFGIVITYKETLLGYGEDTFNEFMHEPICAFLEKHNMDLSVLPPDRLVYMTVEDWDRLIKLKKHTGRKMAEILNDGFKYFRENEVLLFEQVLDKLCRGIDFPALTYLEQARASFA